MKHVLSDNPFYRLAPFLQEYIYRHQWTELREIQVLACGVLFDTADHLLLAAGTASGKTEAAFLPILTDLDQRPPTSIAVLYIGPTKALINDQFYRLEGLLAEAEIPLWAWHGDIAAHRKKKMLQNPSGILQITPESLESLLINHRTQLGRLFADLRYVVIDEVHLFMAADRGRQILCQLARLERLIPTIRPRRIGLSATLGDYAQAEQWLVGGDERAKVQTVASPKSGRLRLTLEQYPAPKAHPQNPTPDPTYAPTLFTAAHERPKTLIFANSRGGVETCISLLREMAQRRGWPDIYHVHHGSIATPLREAAERAMRTEHQPAITAATVTLELGIDLGQLERVIQLGAPYSVASFLQRLGRAGRRGTPPEMWLFLAADAAVPHHEWYKKIPWELLRAVAIIQLYLEEKWIEPIPPRRYPFSLLYHQTMSELVASGELTAAQLAQRVLRLPPFTHITLDDYRLLLRHLLAIDHIEKLPTGGLIVGLAGEKIARQYRFYAVFQEQEEFVVRGKEGEVGRIIKPPAVGERFALAGRTWLVEEIQEAQQIVFVQQVGGRAPSAWQGGGAAVHGRVMQKMGQLLTQEANPSYAYLQPAAADALSAARDLFWQAMPDLERPYVSPLGGGRYLLCPWLGTAGLETLARLLATHGPEAGWQLEAQANPYTLEVSFDGRADDLLPALHDLIHHPAHTAETLLPPDETAPQLAKFDEFIPPELLRQTSLHDILNLAEVRAIPLR